jgi:hypothetical protein
MAGYSNWNLASLGWLICLEPGIPGLAILPEIGIPGLANLLASQGWLFYLEPPDIPGLAISPGTLYLRAGYSTWHLLSLGRIFYFEPGLSV